MRFRIVLLVLSLALVPPLAAEGQQAGKVYQMGWLGVSPPSTKLWDAFQQGLREHGYVEGRNMIIERRYSERNFGRFPALAAELVRLNVDIIIVLTTPAALAAKNATRTVPIVFPTAIDPVRTGVVVSLTRPGENVTGLAYLSPEPSSKRLELLKEVTPGLSRVAVLWNVANPANAPAWAETQKPAASALGVALQSHEVRSPKDFEGAFATMARERPEALLILPDALTHYYGEQIADFATQKRLPVMFPWNEVVEAGGLMSYGPNIYDQYRRAAIYVDISKHVGRVNSELSVVDEVAS